MTVRDDGEPISARRRDATSVGRRAFRDVIVFSIAFGLAILGTGLVWVLLLELAMAADPARADLLTSPWAERQSGEVGASLGLRLRGTALHNVMRFVYRDA
jgi:hypothetical protein